MGFHLNTTLIVRFSSVGDIVLSSLLIRALRTRFPRSEIDFLVKEQYAELVRHNPHLTRTLVLPAGGSASDLQHLRSRVRLSGYDLIIDIHDSLRSRYLCFGAPLVVRLRKRKLARFALVHGKHDLYARFGGDPSVALRYLEPVRHLGVDDDGQGLEVFVTGQDQAEAAEALAGAGISSGTPVLGICPTSRHVTKTWPGERFAGAASAIAAEHGLPVVIFGAGSERDQCAAIGKAIVRERPALRVAVLAGSLSLSATAAAMDSCALVLTNDSGLMHLASARKRKVLALFGPTVRQFGFFPFGTEFRVIEEGGLPCRPCSSIGGPVCPKGHFRCMLDITADRVAGVAGELLGQ
jgi:lipopolysaccharide heptosyltransferase II